MMLIELSTGNFQEVVTKPEERQHKCLRRSSRVSQESSEASDEELLLDGVTKVSQYQHNFLNLMTAFQLPLSAIEECVTPLPSSTSQIEFSLEPGDISLV